MAKGLVDPHYRINELSRRIALLEKDLARVKAEQERQELARTQLLGGQEDYPVTTGETPGSAPRGPVVSESKHGRGIPRQLRKLKLKPRPR